MGKAARIARRSGLGRPARTYRQVFPVWWYLLLLGAAMVCIVAVAANQNLGWGTKLAGLSVPLLFLLPTGWPTGTWSRAG